MIKNSKKLVFNLNILGHGESNPVLLRINLFPDLTKIDFGYTTTDMYINGGWIKISALRNFESKKDWQYFSLFFPPIKQKDMLINFIEVMNGNKNDFNYYNIELKMADAIEIKE